MDTSKISLRLANLEALLKRHIRPEDHKLLFLDPSIPLKFSGQAAPIKKGRPKLPVMEVPEATLLHHIIRYYISVKNWLDIQHVSGRSYKHC
jgi:hypothetical protein